MLAQTMQFKVHIFSFSLFRRLALVGIVLSLCLFSTPAQAQLAFWNGFLGGGAYDIGKGLLLEKDGALVFAGDTYSKDGLARGNHGDNSDVLLFKYASQGIVFWKQVLGGNGEESLSELIKTSDGGFAFIGTTNSEDGDIQESYGNMDIWVVKLSPVGDVEWSNTYGGSGNDRGKAIVETADGGFLIGGASGSINGKMQSRHHGGIDSWIAKLSPQGVVRWEKHLGGKGNDEPTRIHEVSRGNYFVVHASDSQDGDVNLGFGKKDVWITGITEYGNIDWQHTYGGNNNDEIHHSTRDAEGNFILAGTSFSSEGIINRQMGKGDAWALKLNSRGNLIWTRSFGGSQSEGINKVKVTDDGGLIFAGMTKSKDGDIQELNGFYDAWAIKTDAKGQIAWSRTFGFEGKDAFIDVLELPEGGFLALGFAEQLEDGIELPGHQGVHDFWICNFSDPVRRGVKPYITPPLLNGIVKNKRNGNVIEASIALTDNKSLEQLSQTKSNKSDGRYAMTLPTFGLSSLSVEAAGYMPYGENIRAEAVRRRARINRDFELAPIQIGSSLVLKNIFFDTGKWDLLPGSFAELERLIRFMTINPRVKVEISGHTDNTGNKAQKEQLSLNRANAVKDYLVKKGIPEGRFAVKGLGMFRPIASNDTEAGRRKNRRVEFKILNM